MHTVYTVYIYIYTIADLLISIYLDNLFFLMVQIVKRGK